MTTPLYTIIRFTLINRRARTTEPCWLASVSYKDGPGMQVNKMTTTRDRSKAARFSLTTAYTVAVQFSQFPASFERPDGTAMPEESAKLQVEQAARHAEIRQIQAEINREFAEAFAPLLPLLAKAVAKNSGGL